MKLLVIIALISVAYSESMRGQSSTKMGTSYAHPMAEMAALWSAAAYCAKDELESWTCGEACFGTPSDVAVMVENVYGTENRAVMFLDTEQQILVISFRGTRKTKHLVT